VLVAASRLALGPLTVSPLRLPDDEPFKKFVEKLFGGPDIFFNAALHRIDEKNKTYPSLFLPYRRCLAGACQAIGLGGNNEKNTNDVGKNLTRCRTLTDSPNSHSPIQEFFTVDTITHIKSAVVSTPPSALTGPQGATPWTANNSWPKSAKPI
jgi:hypothetical protein